ncbi:MAG: leucine--tRNA ligase [Patescibacteria group bacterium]
MQKHYSSAEIEKKWQTRWLAEKTFASVNPPFSELAPKKAYVLDMFPYPSGAGLHVGHPKGYIATDVLARHLKNKGFNVLHPMGWDAFGLPAENYAIKTGTHPRVTTENNIANYKRQLSMLGFAYDWDREIDTTDPAYYKWTQWIFLKLFERGLAFEQDLPINYCPSCKTGLANEEVNADNTCDRCGTLVERRKLRQWVLKITAYADRLLADVDKLAWPEGIKEMQRNWIGKSEGVEFSMKKVGDGSKSLSVYTTRIDTVYGMTYAVIAADHKDVGEWISDSERAACEAYVAASKSKSDVERTESKEKTGVFSGSYVTNPFNGEEIPVYIGDYVLGSYGTGAVMAVPAHDERDFAFAKKMGLPIRQSVDVGTEFSDDAWKAEYAVDGKVLETGASSAEARKALATKAESEGFGKTKVNYKLRDWLFSRQRYWGEPIPLVHLDIENVKKLPHIADISQATDANLAYILKREPQEGESCEGATCHGKVRELVIGGKVFSKIYDGIYSKIVCDYRLPLELPEVERYEPAGDGQSPLATVDSFVNVKLAENLVGRRETNTMPQWGGSCWYYLRYLDPKNSEALVSKEAAEYWGSVDQYVGGAEHAVLHLLYARFWHKFLFDIGVVPTDEPFAKLASPGLILGSDGNKMSKSKGNVVNPDDVCKQYGTDTFRVYEMSMSDFRDPAPWNTDAIVGSERFLEKAYAAFGDSAKSAADDMKAMKLLHKTVKKVGEDIGNFKFNTAITAINILLNEGVPADAEFRAEWREKVAVLLHPFAPHLAEELWESLGNSTSVYLASWPEYDTFMLADDEVTIAVQVNGKLRGTLTMLNGVAQEEAASAARENPEISKWIEGKTLVREIFVPNKLLNIVVKD